MDTINGWLNAGVTAATDAFDSAQGFSVLNEGQKSSASNWLSNAQQDITNWRTDTKMNVLGMDENQSNRVQALTDELIGWIPKVGDIPSTIQTLPQVLDPQGVKNQDAEADCAYCAAVDGNCKLETSRDPRWGTVKTCKALGARDHGVAAPSVVERKEPVITQAYEYVETKGATTYEVEVADNTYLLIAAVFGVGAITIFFLS